MVAVRRLLLACVALLAGCGNATGFLPVAKKQRPVAVINAPAGPLAALGNYLADGSASHDPDGHIVAWHWSVSARPDGSQLALSADASAADGSKVRFQPDLVGAYQVRLVVTDDDGLDSLPTLYDFSTADQNGLRLELTWDRDFTDVDLHLVDESAGGSFFTQPLDCYFQNKTPDWGVAGSSADDPVLPFDQDQGYGPEVIGIQTPVAGNSYHVFAHYYCDDGFGGTQATVKLFSHGVVAAEAHAMLVRTGDLWDVARVVFSTSGAPTLSVSTAAVVTTSRGCN